MKILYKEKYKRNRLKIRDGLTPICRHQKDGFDVDSAYVLQAGVIEERGERKEFQDIRVFFKERK